MSPTKPPHFWASLENEIKNLIVFDFRNYAESMFFKQTYSCILHPKKKKKNIKVLCEQTHELTHDFDPWCLMLSGLGNFVVDCHI